MSQQTGRGTFKGVYGPLQTVGFGVLGELCKNGWTDLNDLYVASRSATSSRADRKLDNIMEFRRELVCDLLVSWTA